VKNLLPIGLALLLNLSTSTAASHDSFNSVVTPFVNEHCAECHDEETTKGDVQLDNLSGAMNSAANAGIWLKVLDELQADLMPPQKKDRPEHRARTEVIRWIESRLEQTGHGEAYRAKLLLPEYGNWVDHDSLFNGDITTPPSSPSRLWRLSPDIYTANQARNTNVPFTYSTKESDIRDFAATSIVDQSTIETIMVTVNKMLENEIFKVRGGEQKVISFDAGKNKKKVIAPDPKHQYAPFVLSDAPPTEDQRKVLIHREFPKTHRRPPTKEELAKYLGFLDQNIRGGGNLEAMKATILAMHLSPEAIYRKEIGLGPEDEHGRRALSPNELAYALAYALSDKNPYTLAPTREALQKGNLNTQEDVATLVRELLKPKKAFDPTANPRLLRFFAEFFGYRHTLDVFKDDERQRSELGFPLGNRGPLSIVTDLENWIRLILARDRQVLETILTSDKFLIAHNGDNAKARETLTTFYSPANIEKSNERQRKRMEKTLKESKAMGFTPFPGNTSALGHVRAWGFPHLGAEGQRWDWPVEQPIQIENRKGILTHPGWLWAHSTNFDNDPIHRGIWIYTRLLAGVIPDVPPTVDARVPEDPHKTLRERLELIRAEDCWKCHRKINPLGETFEIFDDYGRHRERLYFDKEKTLFTKRDNEFKKLLAAGQLTERSIDATGELRDSGDPSLDGPVTDAFELIDKLARSDRARQSFIRHAFRYFMGRNETLADSRTLIAADRAYLESDGSFNALLVSLLSSDSFFYRKDR
jgi:hypothetical protein